MLTGRANVLADSVTPLSAFAIGVFMYQRLPTAKAVWASFGIQMIVKIWIMPLLVMPFLLAFSIQVFAPGRACEKMCCC
jgi:predicted permease